MASSPEAGVGRKKVRRVPSGGTNPEADRLKRLAQLDAKAQRIEKERAELRANASREQVQPQEAAQPQAQAQLPKPTANAIPLAYIVAVVAIVLVSVLAYQFLGPWPHFTTSTTRTTSVSHYNHTNVTVNAFRAAATTNSSGALVFNISGQPTVFRFVSQKTGLPLEGLVVGLAVNDSDGVGALFTIDPQNRTKPQMIILAGNQSGGSIGVAADPEVALSDQAGSSIKTVFLNNLPRIKNASKTIGDLLEFTPLALKAIYAANVPLGDYADSIGLGVNRETYTQDGYVQHLGNSVKDKVKENLFWAFGYNIVAIPLGMGILYPFFAQIVSPELASLLMAASSLSVTLNTLRMRGFVPAIRRVKS